MPRPQNISLAHDLESLIRRQGATPATVGVVKGIVTIGLNAGQLEFLASAPNVQKVGPRDFARVVARGESGCTTVGGTLVAARAVGIQVFATGGIGGVHRRPPLEFNTKSVGKTRLSVPAQFDISADLPQLAITPMIVVCAGAKAILDLPATLEYLETWGVPVIGYQTDTFPAFYSQSSGLPVSVRAESPEQVALIARTHWEMGLKSALLVVVPPPSNLALPPETIQQAIDQALQEATEKKVVGQQVTPFLLNRVSELTGGASLQANMGLLRNNVQIAASIARYLVGDIRLRRV